MTSQIPAEVDLRDAVEALERGRSGFATLRAVPELVADSADVCEEALRCAVNRVESVFGKLRDMTRQRDELAAKVERLEEIALVAGPGGPLFELAVLEHAAQLLADALTMRRHVERGDPEARRLEGALRYCRGNVLEREQFAQTKLGEALRWLDEEARKEPALVCESEADERTHMVTVQVRYADDHPAELIRARLIELERLLDEAQRKGRADAALLDAGMIRLESWGSVGEPVPSVWRGVNLRAAIQDAITSEGGR